ncbi:MAG TPA: histidine kinase [Pseudonocardiaceae bacterium]|nr:histidine kinase [Pseudonocardiaceae bacterium]
MNQIVIMGRWQDVLAALRPLPARRPRLSGWAWTADALLAVALTGGAVYDALTVSEREPSTTGLPSVSGVPSAPLAPVLQHIAPAQWWQVLLVALSVLPLFARRRFPMAAFWVVVGAGALNQLTPALSPTFTLAACVIAACSAVLYSPYQVLATASALVGTGLIIGEHTDTGQTIGPGSVILLLVVAAGFVLPTWRRRVHTIAAEQRAATQDALEQERSRIARELHDVVTHNVSMMIVQAGAARSAMAVTPERAGLALRNVESVGRAAMTELRHIMGLLTVNTDNPDQVAADELLPPPGIAQLDPLVDRVRDTGTTVTLSVSLPSHPLPSGVDLAAYRVVQEALTNVGKHAAGAAVTINIDHTPGELRVEIVDTGGIATSAAHSGSGRGLIGMRERLAVYGGSLHAGDLPTAGYRVYAVIPLELP